ncbi:HAD family hydrolase [Sphingobacterium lumbrici]|uniref:HAD family hydrolase n=1 Tax=Sphingobacterium lumbrici TaxID=2559600 RepID=UPI00112B52AA|nr:HAD family phosphatase [Sphingobacterium lumbrici]
MIAQLDAVLFDLDGTLIDSEFFYYSNWSPILAKEFGLQITFEDWIQYFAGHTLVRNVGMLMESYGIETTEEFMWKETRANYAKSDMTTIRLMPYAREILEKLITENIRLALVTSSYRTTVDTVLGHHGLLEYFEFFITREKVVHAKPNPEPYLLATEILGVPQKNIIAIEDTSTGCAAAQGAGLTCIAVTKYSSEIKKLSKADSIVGSLKEVSGLLFANE